jgi:HlyD family secretion protein
MSRYVDRPSLSRLALLLLGIAGSTLALGCGGGESEVEIPTAAAERKTIRRIVVATGTVEPEGEVEVRPRIAGIVDRIRVEEGDLVDPGQVLIEVERELIEARVREARALLEVAEVEHRFARIQLARARELQRKGASSDSQLDDAEARFESAVASRSRAQAGLTTLEVELRYATVRAPQAGKVLDVAVELGAAVSPVTSVTGGTVLVTMAGTDRLHLKGSVDENEIARVEVGQRALIRTEAFGDRSFEGSVREIAPLAQSGVPPALLGWQAEFDNARILRRKLPLVSRQSIIEREFIRV